MTQQIKFKADSIELASLTLNQKNYILKGFIESKKRRGEMNADHAIIETLPEIGANLGDYFYSLESIVSALNTMSDKTFLTHYVKQIKKH